MSAEVKAGHGALSDRIVAISVSDSADLARLGMLDRELMRVLAEFVTALVYQGARIAYGGDLRAGGFTQRLFSDVVGAYALGNLDKRIATFIHCAAYPVWRQWSARELFEHVVSLELTGEVRLFFPDGTYYALYGDESGVFPSGVTPEEMQARSVITTPGQLEPLWDRDRAPGHRKGSFLQRIADRLRRPVIEQAIGAGLSAMRETMARETDVRIVIGGKVTGYTGHAPGIAEEALKTLQHGKPLIPVASFGGCARFVAHALGLLDDADLLKQAEVGLNFHETLAEISVLRASYLEDMASRGITREALVEISRTDTPARVAQLCTAALVKAFGHSGN